MAANREGRRRKILRDEARSVTSGSAPKTSAVRKRSSRRIYSDEARASNQPRITDLIPKQPWVLGAVWFLGLLVPLLLAAATYLSMDRSTTGPPVGGPANFSLATIAAASRWWTGNVLLAAAVISGVTYHLRRYKLDDYRARYRIWLVAAVLALLSSVVAATDLLRGLYLQSATWLSAAPYEALQRWWVPGTACLIIVGYVRLAMEMWCSRGASVMLFLAAACYAIVGLVQLSIWPITNLGIRDLVAFSAVHLGHHQLVFAMLLFCRHVYRSAQGSSASRTRKRKTRRSTRETVEADANGNARLQRTDSRSEDAEFGEEQPSRSELRRQRKDLRRQQRRAA